jgi:putative aldouronate transport system substrate-binding protein
MTTTRRSRRARQVAIVLMLLTAAAGIAFGAGGTAAANKGRVKLTFIVPGTPQKDQEMVNKAVTEYLKKDLNIELNLQQIDWASWDNRNNLIVASGEECDVLYTAAWTGYVTNAGRGAFVDLTPMIPTAAPELLKTPYAWTLDVAKINGRIYAVPTYQFLAQSRGFFLRKDLLEKYKPAGFTIDPMKNDPRGLEPLFDAILRNEPGMVPWFAVPGKYLSFMGPFDRQGKEEVATLDVTDKVPVYKNFFDTDWYRQMMKVSRQWFVKGYINKDAATTTELGISKFTAGAAFCWAEQTNVRRDVENTLTTGLPVTMYRILPPIIGTGLVQGAMLSVPLQSKNKERAPDVHQPDAHGQDPDKHAHLRA